MANGQQRSDKLSLIQRIQNLFRRAYPHETAEVLTTERPFPFDLTQQTFFPYSNTRQAKYSDYDRMDEEVVEVSAALDVYADFITSSGVGEDRVFRVEYTKADENPEGQEFINQIVEKLQGKTDIQNLIWSIARDLVKYGDVFIEIISTDAEIIKLKILPPETMFRASDYPDGKRRDSSSYIQINPFTKGIHAEFANWEIVHIKSGYLDYGVDFSLLRRLRRVFRLHRLLEDLMVVGRVSRTPLRGIHYVDVTGMGAAEAEAFIRKLRSLNRQRRIFDTKGQLSAQADPYTMQEDIYVPIRRGAAGQPFQLLSTDVNYFRAVEDVSYFHSKLFSGTKVPKAYLGFERDVNAKATLIEQSVAFIRCVKRYRGALAEGLKKIIKIQGLLHGRIIADDDIRIVFADIGSPDEHARWSIELMKAQLLSAYRSMGLDLPIEWVLKNLFVTVPQDEIELILNHIKKSSGAASPSPPQPASAPSQMSLPFGAAAPSASSPSPPSTPTPALSAEPAAVGRSETVFRRLKRRVGQLKEITSKKEQNVG